MLTLISLLVYGSSSNAMCLHKSLQMVAWNAAGNAALIRESSSGPEGGGAILYYIFDFTKKNSESYAFSSTFSPGDGSEPQNISSDACSKAAAAGNKTLATLGFKIKFDGAKCRSKDRAMVPSTATAAGRNGINTLAFTENASCAAACRWTIETKPVSQGNCF